MKTEEQIRAKAEELWLQYYCGKGFDQEQLRAGMGARAAQHFNSLAWVLGETPYQLSMQFWQKHLGKTSIHEQLRGLTNNPQSGRITQPKE